MSAVDSEMPTVTTSLDLEDIVKKLSDPKKESEETKADEIVMSVRRSRSFEVEERGLVYGSEYVSMRESLGRDSIGEE